jgi:hypothetical protein
LVAVVMVVRSASGAVATIPGGTNILHVPMSWCVVNGSPAAVSPNVTSEGTTVADTTTDAVIWRRHERPTDNVYTPQASISLRSSINNAWGTLSFPIIADPDTTHGLQGDVDSTTNEATTMVNNCDTAYTNLGRSGIGITAVNVNLWDDANGGHIFQVGLGGCSYVPGQPCSQDFFIVVTDNHYMYPTVPNRQIPGDGTLIADPFDVTVGHETGHALGLPHRTDPTALMNPTLTDNNGDGRIDNIGLNASEVSTLRATANNVPGLEVDPEGTFLPGPRLEMRLMDGPEQKLPRNLDLAALSLLLDTKTDTAHVIQRLWGLLPCKSLKPTTYEVFADLDNAQATGASPALLARLGFRTAPRGADLLARTKIVGSKKKGRDYSTCQSSMKAWIVTKGRVTALPRSKFDARIATMRAWRVFSSTGKPQTPPLPLVVNLFNSIDFSFHLRGLATKFKIDRPVRLSGGVVSRGKLIDRFGKGARGARFILQRPRFPHCFPAGPGTPGGKVAITFDGLRPNLEIHALLGPIEVLRGVKTDAKGSGQINFPIPEGARRGNHLVTIGHDGLALTADCTLTVQ